MRIFVFRGNYRDTTLEPMRLASFNEYIKRSRGKKITKEKVV
jgi:hypothetical protein